MLDFFPKGGDTCRADFSRGIECRRSTRQGFACRAGKETGCKRIKIINGGFSMRKRRFLRGCIVAWLIAWAVCGSMERTNAQTAKQNAAAQRAPEEKFDPTNRYIPRQIEGWHVLVHPALLMKGTPDFATGEQALRELEMQLYQIKRHVPVTAVKKLQQVRLWLEKDEPHHPCATYHPNREWLIEHAMNPDKYRCVEISNAAAFVAWTKEQPWMVLHELSHAYHDQFLPQGFQNPTLLTCYQSAVKSKRYEAVLRAGLKEKARAYALANPMEYFAEATEAFFGCNDFYPFTRVELENHDPDLYQALIQLWNIRE
jgi:hypothetical protein